MSLYTGVEDLKSEAEGLHEGTGCVALRGSGREGQFALLYEPGGGPTLHEFKFPASAAT